MSTLPTRPSVFISYAHADKQYLDQLKMQLTPVLRHTEIEVWSDKEIQISQNWHDEIQKALDRATAAVLLISADFLASSYVSTSELPALLKAASDKGLKVFAIIISPCGYSHAEFRFPDPRSGPHRAKLSSLQAANPPSKTLTEMGSARRQRVFLSVAEAIRALADGRDATAKGEKEGSWDQTKESGASSEVQRAVRRGKKRALRAAASSLAEQEKKSEDPKAPQVSNLRIEQTTASAPAGSLTWSNCSAAANALSALYQKAPRIVARWGEKDPASAATMDVLKASCSAGKSLLVIMELIQQSPNFSGQAGELTLIALLEAENTLRRAGFAFVRFVGTACSQRIGALLQKLDEQATNSESILAYLESHGEHEELLKIMAQPSGDTMIELERYEQLLSKLYETERKLSIALMKYTGVRRPRRK